MLIHTFRTLRASMMIVVTCVCEWHWYIHREDRADNRPMETMHIVIITPTTPWA